MTSPSTEGGDVILLIVRSWREPELMCTTHADHATACSARMQLLDLIFNAIHDGEDWLIRCKAN